MREGVGFLRSLMCFLQVLLGFLNLDESIVGTHVFGHTDFVIFSEAYEAEAYS